MSYKSTSIRIHWEPAKTQIRIKIDPTNNLVGQYTHNYENNMYVEGSTGCTIFI